jgi:hypothetical protein
VNAACQGSNVLSDHMFTEIGRCPHEVGGATYIYLESGCTDCGATARQTVVYACGTRKPRVQPTVENCLALKWKGERQVALNSQLPGTEPKGVSRPSRGADGLQSQPLTTQAAVGVDVPTREGAAGAGPAVSREAP